MNTQGNVILSTRDLVVEFKGFRAVNAVNLTVHTGTIHALIGPNGAGKTTCFNALTRFLQPTSGSIFFEGRDITHLKAATLARQGMVRSFQISAVFPHFTVLENVRLALQRRLNSSFHFWRNVTSLNQLNLEARKRLDEVGLLHLENTRAAELPYGSKRTLEIATTLALEPKLMLLDEPTQGMAHEEVENIMQLIKRIAAKRTILMVEHNMKVVAGICSRITVLVRGGVLVEGSYQDIAADPRVIEAYIGRSAHAHTAT